MISKHYNIAEKSNSAKIKDEHYDTYIMSINSKEISIEDTFDKKI